MIENAMTMKDFIAIDPGASGGVAHFSKGALLGVHPMTEAKRATRLNIEGVVLEQVNGVPGQSASGAFRFGQSYGHVRGLCDAVDLPITDVPPQVWKGALGLRRGVQTVAAYKRQARELAQELFPDHAASFARAKDDGLAEAALIGYWYLNKRIEQ